MKLNFTQIAIALTVIVGGGLLFLLVSQKGNDIESKYREIVDVFATAREIGLDEEQFKQDIDSEEIHNRVAEDKSEGETLMAGQVSTPALFLNGQRYSNGQTIDELLQGLKTEIQNMIDNEEEKPVLKEFFDYNCVHCANLEKGLNEVVTEFGDQIVFEKKHLPFLRSSSTTYAYAAEAAHKQGKLKEYSELLFSKIHGI